MSELKFEIKDQIGVLSTNKSNWTKEVNFVKWGDNRPKLDIRDWAPNHEYSGRGITLTFKEALKLQEILKKYTDEHRNELAEALE